MPAVQKFPEFDSASGGLNGSTNDFLSAILYGGKCLADDFVNVTAAAIITFADLPGGIPVGAKAALVVIEADATEANAARVARFTQDGVVNPAAAVGMPVGDNGSFEIRGSDNLANFKIIGITAAKTHVMRVQFFGAKT